jgi:hypothetical protein
MLGKRRKVRKDSMAAGFMNWRDDDEEFGDEEEGLNRARKSDWRNRLRASESGKI